MSSDCCIQGNSLTAEYGLNKAIKRKKVNNVHASKYAYRTCYTSMDDWGYLESIVSPFQ